MIIKRDKKKQEKTNILTGMINELKKMVWPTKKDLIIYSIVVIFIIIIFSIIIGIYDLILTKLMSFLFKINK